jgi:hypothetical protein
MRLLKRNIFEMLVMAAITMAFTIRSFSDQQEPETWSENQLIEPAELAEILNYSSKYL